MTLAKNVWHSIDLWGALGAELRADEDRFVQVILVEEFEPSGPNNTVHLSDLDMRIIRLSGYGFDDDYRKAVADYIGIDFWWAPDFEGLGKHLHPVRDDAVRAYVGGLCMLSDDTKTQIDEQARIDLPKHSEDLMELTYEMLAIRPASHFLIMDIPSPPLPSGARFSPNT